MQERVSSPKLLEGAVAPPGDKSISHRAALLNSIASGTALVTNFCAGDDRTSMLRCLRGLHVDIEHEPAPSGDEAEDRFIIHGKGLDGLREPDEVLDSGNSGTTMRLVSGLLAGQAFFSVITGDRSLRSRPMDRIVRPLREMGAQVMGRGGGTKAPLAFGGGGLQGIEYEMPVASAQLKSCLLIAGLHARGQTIVHEPAASRDHTERMLRAMGGQVEQDGLRIAVRPSDLTSIDVRVPCDISGAAYWLVAGCCHPRARISVEGVGINPSRTGILSVLESMRAVVEFRNVRDDGGEPAADIVVQSSPLEGTEIAGAMIPQLIDELPVLALAACYARGTTVIRDAQELRVKESDRIRATVEGLRSLGADISSAYQGSPVADDAEQRDGMIINGPVELHGAVCQSYGDHRIAMTMAIAGLVSQGETIIEGAEAAGVSYPAFWSHLQSLSTGAANAAR